MEGRNDFEAFALRVLDEGEQFYWHIPTWEGDACCRGIAEVERLVYTISEGTMYIKLRADHDKGHWYIGVVPYAQRFDE
jgi:hypothetical protein